jgi:hypothetical protein
MYLKLKEMRISYISLLIAFLFIDHTKGQSGTTIFDNSYLHEIKINFEEDDYWDILTDNYGIPIPGEPNEQDIPYLSGSILLDGNPYEKVGVRFKGFSSYFFVEGNKKSFKLDFNEFVEDRKIDGLRKLNLNNGVGDPAFQREFICYDLLRKMGIPAPRVAFTKVYINDVYWGLYSLVEQIDKSFLKDNYVDNDGALYKNVGWSEMLYIDDEQSSYMEFDKKTRETESWDDLIELIKRINSDKSTYVEDLEEVFYVDDYLKVLALDMIINNWDSYHQHGRNWFLYKDSTSQKFHWQPWDYNLAFGGTFDGGNPLVPGDTICTFRSKIDFLLDNNNASLSICDAETIDSPTINWYSDGEFIGNDLEINVPITDFTHFITAQLIYQDQDEVCNLDLYTNIITFDGWFDCPSTSQSNFTHDINDSRVQEVLFSGDCCEIWGEDCEDLLQNFSCHPNNKIQNLSINQVDSEKVLNKKLLQIPTYNDRYLSHICKAYNFLTEETIMPNAFQNIALIADAISIDTNYVFSFNNFRYDISEGNSTSDIPSLVEFINKRRADVEDQLRELGVNCETQTIDVLEWQDVVINELVASNTITSGIVDEKGESEDWIELFNNTNKELNLNGYFLTDKKSDLTKWAFPTDAKIKPNEYLIIWADENKNDGPLHCNFKLSKSGEQVYLSNGSMYVDSLTFPSLDDNESYSRIPNGTGDFVKKNATFGFDNTKTSSTLTAEIDNLILYPNPANHLITVKHINFIKDLSIFDITGRKLFTSATLHSNEAKINISDLEKGVYFVELTTTTSKAVKKFVKQ